MSSRLTAVLLCLAAAVAVALLLAAPGNLRWQAQPGTACDDLRALQSSLDLTSLGDQAVIRARAVQLAAALAGTERARPTDSAEREVQAQALRRLQRVIADPEATSHDLAAALTPLAESCSITLVD